MNTGRYKSTKKSTATIQQAGYTEAFIAPLSYFTTLQEPVLSSTPVIGEAYTIGTSHVFASGKGAISVYVNKDVLEVVGDSTGAVGYQRMAYKPKVVLPGDGPVNLEIFNNLLNEECVLFLKVGCDTDGYVQIGCDCSPSEVSKGSFASGTVKGTDIVGYTLEFESLCKYFYNGSLTLLP